MTYHGMYWRMTTANSLAGLTVVTDSDGTPINLAGGGWTVTVTAYPLDDRGAPDFSAAVAATVVSGVDRVTWRFAPGAIDTPGPWVVDVVAVSATQHQSRLWSLSVTDGPPS